MILTPGWEPLRIMTEDEKGKLTSEQENQDEGKQVRVLCQHPTWHLHCHGGFKEVRDLLLDQAVKG